MDRGVAQHQGGPGKSRTLVHSGKVRMASKRKPAGKVGFRSPRFVYISKEYFRMILVGDDQSFVNNQSFDRTGLSRGVSNLGL